MYNRQQNCVNYQTYAFNQRNKQVNKSMPTTNLILITYYNSAFSAGIAVLH